jgi:hypothetical protein
LTPQQIQESYAVAKNERNEVSLKGSVQTDTMGVKKDTSPVIKVAARIRVSDISLQGI